VKLIDPEFEAMQARLHRACLTIAALPSDGPKGFFSTWPRYKLDWWDAEDWGSQRTDRAVTQRLISPPRFSPTPAEVDDCLPALSLLDAEPSSPRQARKFALYRRVLALRAHQLWYGEHAGADERYAHWRGGWRMIGETCGVSHITARHAHREAVNRAIRVNQIRYRKTA
jgi:hypothetical protein